MRSEEGGMVVRSIARLVWADGYSEDKKEPVIYLEPIYSLNHDPMLKKAFIEQARMLAGKLGIRLLFSKTFEDRESDSFKDTLQMFGSMAPYEYCDALRGIIDWEHNSSHQSIKL